MTRAEKLDWLRLAYSENVGAATFHALIERYRSARRALEALPGLALRGGKRRLGICSHDEAAQILDRTEHLGANLIALDEPNYPALLRHIDAPPPLIWAMGNTARLNASAIGIVGSRNASASGRTLARRFASELGHMGFVIVSGLARGIDTAAHEASLQTGTIAVLAGGIDVIYPAENTDLAKMITETGTLITEMAPGIRPQAKHFPRRNRLIAGLSLGVLVIEAAERSGSLITARLALEQGRDVFAVPGSPLDPRSAGTNRLIRRGAMLVTSARDVTDALDPMMRSPHSHGFAATNSTETVPIRDMPESEVAEPEISHNDRSRLIDLLGATPVAVDALIRESGMEIGIIHMVLLELELAGKLIRSDRHHVALSPESTELAG